MNKKELGEFQIVRFGFLHAYADPNDPRHKIWAIKYGRLLIPLLRRFTGWCDG